MKDTALKEKIDGLPENLKEQVSDYVDFLLYRYGDSKPSLTADEKSQLERRWEAYQQGISPASTLEEVKKRLEKKHGVSS